MANEQSLGSKIQEYMDGNIDKEEDMPKICANLREDREIAYGRNITQKIGRNPYILYDEMTKRGHIKKDDYSVLIRILEISGLGQVAARINELIDEHRQSQRKRKHSEPSRPSQLTLKQMSANNNGGRYSSPMTSPPPAYADMSAPMKRQRGMGTTPSTGSVGSVDADGFFPPRSQYLSGKDSHYPFGPGSKGLVAIINNFTKKREKLFRNGTVEDEKRIVDLFKGGLFTEHYDVLSPERDLDRDAFLAFLDELVETLKSEPQKYNSFFLFILSHGEKDGVTTYHISLNNNSNQTSSEHVIPIEEITGKFKTCIPERPKVFIIQACQGADDNVLGEEVEGDVLISGTAQPNDMPEDPDESIEEVESDIVMNVKGPPDAADILTAFATVKGYQSYRGMKANGAGSWFIRNLIEQLGEAHSENYFPCHFLDILTECQNKVSQHRGRRTQADGPSRVKKVLVRQMPCFHSSLRRKFYLLPPNY